MINLINNKGFQLTFLNGLTISVMFGGGNYCQNRLKKDNEPIEFSNDCEIAIWDRDEKWLSFGSDEVNGYITPDFLADYIDLTKKAKSLAELQQTIQSIKTLRN